MDIIDEITEDHRQIREKMELLLSENPGQHPSPAEQRAAKQAAFSDLSSLLGDHTEAEERTVYACAKRMGALQHLATIAEKDHEGLEAMLESVRNAPGSAIQRARSIALAKLLKHHLALEEEIFLPALRRELTVIDRDRLARKYRRAMRTPALSLVGEERSAEILPLPLKGRSSEPSPLTVH